jgi:hypothetical protein
LGPLPGRARKFLFSDRCISALDMSLDDHLQECMVSEKESRFEHCILYCLWLSKKLPVSVAQSSLVAYLSDLCASVEDIDGRKFGLEINISFKEPHNISTELSLQLEQLKVFAINHRPDSSDPKRERMFFDVNGAIVFFKLC